MLIPEASTDSPADVLTRVGLGTWELGGPSRFGWGPVDDDDSIDTIRHAISSGVNWVDTAAFYGRGHSEEVVGKAIEPWQAGDEIMVSTKCGLRWDPETHRDTPPHNSLKPESIRFECEQSLRRLKVERLDLYHFHWPDETGTPIEESWGVMAELVDAGKVRWAGLSNFSLADLEACEPIRHVDCLQPPLNLIDRRALVELIPWCRDHATAVVAYSPMASGLLTGTFDAQAARSLPPTDWRSEAPQFKEPSLSKTLALVSRMQPIADEQDITMPELAIAWVVANEGVAAAIVGAKRRDEVDGWMRVKSLELDRATCERIEMLIVETGVGLDQPD